MWTLGEKLKKEVKPPKVSLVGEERMARNWELAEKNLIAKSRGGRCRMKPEADKSVKEVIRLKSVNPNSVVYRVLRRIALSDNAGASYEDLSGNLSVSKSSLSSILSVLIKDQILARDPLSKRYLIHPELLGHTTDALYRLSRDREVARRRLQKASRTTKEVKQPQTTQSVIAEAVRASIENILGLKVEMSGKLEIVFRWE
jgi:hypothetical protein